MGGRIVYRALQVRFNQDGIYEEGRAVRPPQKLLKDYLEQFERLEPGSPFIGIKQTAISGGGGVSAGGGPAFGGHGALAQGLS